MLKPIYITAYNLTNAWFETLYKCVELGKNFKIDRGSNAGQDRREFDFITVQITNPDEGDLIPQLSEASPIPNPVEDGYLDSYMPYLMTGEEKEGEAYTYGQRICKVAVGEIHNRIDPILVIEEERMDSLPENVLWLEKANLLLNQMELMIWTYKNKGYRNNQMVLQVGQPSDMLLKDPPCLRHIDTRIQDDKLHFFPYFRSWDLYGGFPANLAAIELMKQYCAEQIGVENGEIIASSKGLHLYDYVWEIAESIRGKTMNEFRLEQNISYENHISRE